MSKKPSDKKNVGQIIQAGKPKWMEWMLLFVIGCGLYLPSLQNEYVLDDVIVFTQNRYVGQGLAGIGDILSKESFAGYFQENAPNFVSGARYRPFSLVTFAVENTIFGKNALISHLINALLYGLLGVLIFYLGHVLWPKTSVNWKWLSFPLLLSLLFLIHPIHSEAVANVKGRDEILALIFSLSALLSAFKYYRAPKISWGVLSGIFLFVAFLSKENTLAFSFILPLTLLLFDGAKKSRFTVIIAVTLIALIGYLWMRYVALDGLFPAKTFKGDLMNEPFVGMDLGEKSATIVYTLGYYLKLLFLPFPLTHDYYPYHIPKMQWADILVVLSLVANIGLLLFGLFNFKRKKVIFWSVVVYFSTLFIVSNIPFTVGTFMNERFIFMPSLGVIAIVAYYLLQGISSAKKIFRYVSLGLMVAIIISFIFITLTRIPDWKNGFTLNQSALKVSRNSARINMFSGTDYYNLALNEGDLSKKRELLNRAKQLLEKSISIYPLYGSANNMLTGTCAEIYKENNNINQLLSCFEEVGARRPDTEYLNRFLEYLVDRGFHSDKLTAFYIRLGYDRLYMEKKNYPHAIKFLLEAEKMKPNDKELFSKISTVYLEFGNHLQQYPDPKYKTADIINAGRNYGMKSLQ